jgi:hypothetical protein
MCKGWQSPFTGKIFLDNEILSVQSFNELYILALLGICDDAVACRTVPALLEPEGKIVHV